MRNAVEYLGKVGVGITGPEFYRADDEKIYVVKRMNNMVGNGVLVSEYLSAKLGEKLRLIFPPSDTIALEKFLPTKKGAIKRHFASQYIPNCRYAAAENMMEADNLSQMAGIILFDHVFHNADRTNNRKNILLSSNEGHSTIYAIDNSHLFRTGRWNAETLERLSEQIKCYPNYIYGVLLKKHLLPEDFIPFLNRFRALSAEEIEQILKTTPKEWYEDEQVPQAISRYIARRLSLIESIFDAILKKIPKERGGLADARKFHPL